jgi:hypothetical protein
MPVAKTARSAAGGALRPLAAADRSRRSSHLRAVFFLQLKILLYFHLTCIYDLQF